MILFQAPHGSRILELASRVSILLTLTWMTAAVLAQAPPNEEQAPSGFVELRKVIPDILIELRYHSPDNFTGSPVPGYTEALCWMTEAAATQLAKVQDDLRPFGLGLKVFDAYRPKQAVAHFVEWVQDGEPARTKQRYFPNLDKRQLIEKGYISDKSGHSRGSTIDLTLVELPNETNPAPRELAMGTPFDYFGKESWTAASDLTSQQRRNRLLLKSVMERHGFVNYFKEWWHFRLRDEPFPKTYFDFPTGVTSPASKEER